MKVFTLVFLPLTYVSILAGEEKLAPAAFAAKRVEVAGILLDVRSPAEFEKGHLSGAVNLNFYDEDFAARLSEKNKETTYFIYCHSGGRSGKTLTLMKTAGFKHVYELKGGISAWQAKHMPIQH